MTYAQNTTVTVERSIAEIRTVLKRYGADQFMQAEDETRNLAMIDFRVNNRRIRFVLKLPHRDEFRRTLKKRNLRSPKAIDKAYEQGQRQRWRALLLCIKAKLEAVEAGITSFDDEFMAHIVAPDGRTMSEIIQPQIEHAYQAGAVPSGIAGLLPEPKQ